MSKLREPWINTPIAPPPPPMWSLGSDTEEEAKDSGGSDTASWAASSDGFSTDVSDTRLS